MRLFLRWEVHMFLNCLQESPGNYIEPAKTAMMNWCLNFKIPVSVNEARAVLQAKGPHPDYITGRTPNRGAAMIWDDDVVDAEDDDIPAAVIAAYEFYGWTTRDENDNPIVPWIPPPAE